ncbi:hypothetical protein IHE45_19G081600 [Dioscorea alata]|uniref:Uncharacterized protein n=1 Tax=Dioscorea alata TaxID=55571 RepID=A0ACB7TZG7_DIOAL|nr:hypothetical protein IHE45_19G081600 [Dioscorea alata]
MDNLTSPTSAMTNKRNNHQWSPAEYKVLVEYNGFKIGYLTQLQKWMAENIPSCKIMGDPHIKSRMRTFKAQFRELKEMRGHLGLDGMKLINTLLSYANYFIKLCFYVQFYASGLGNKAFLYFDELAIIFGKDQMTGDGAEFASESVEAIERENSTFAVAKEKGAIANARLVECAFEEREEKGIGQGSS